MQAESPLSFCSVWVFMGLYEPWTPDCLHGSADACKEALLSGVCVRFASEVKLQKESSVFEETPCGVMADEAPDEVWFTALRSSPLKIHNMTVFGFDSDLVNLRRLLLLICSACGKSLARVECPSGCEGCWACVSDSASRSLKALCVFGCLSTVVCGKILWFTMENETRPSLLSSPEKQSNPANTEDTMETFTDYRSNAAFLDVHVYHTEVQSQYIQQVKLEKIL